ncbi:MAG: APC family permease [Clostridium sp.]|uniref:APC family permease n=1 Tax=Clostridium sp. TaxID=1506 RepID=UPI003EE4488C
MNKGTKKKLGLFSIVLLGFNAIVGTGIFLLPNKAMALMGPASIFVIIFDAILAISIALCFAEMGGMFRKNGAAYVYTRKTFGKFAGFEVGIMTYAVSIIAQATMAAGFVTALSVFWPAADKGMTKDIIITVFLIILTLINLVGVNFTKIIMNISTIGKILPLIVFVAVGIFFIKGGNFHPMLPHGVYTHGNFGVAVLLIFFAFTGFESIALAAEDMKNPDKNIPRAIILVMLIVSVVYILVQSVSIGILGSSLATNTNPVASASSRFLGSFGGILVSLGILVSITGINIAQSFMTPRLASALADDDLLPRPMGKYTKRGVPAIALVISMIITLPIALSGSFTTLAIISSISRFAQYLPTCLAVIVMRYKKKDMPRNFKVPFGPIIPAVAIIVSIWVLLQSSLSQILGGLGGLIIALPLYFIMKYYTKKHPRIFNSNKK